MAEADFRSIGLSERPDVRNVPQTLTMRPRPARWDPVAPLVLNRRRVRLPTARTLFQEP